MEQKNHWKSSQSQNSITQNQMFGSESEDWKKANNVVKKWLPGSRVVFHVELPKKRKTQNRATSYRSCQHILQVI
jgi:hypothetical protein